MFKLYHKLLDVLFPRLCFNCGIKVSKNEPLLCNKCFSKIPIFQTLFCAVCHARLPDSKKLCHKDAQYILAAATAYEGLVKKLIWDLKYNKKLAAAEPLKKIAEIYFNNLIEPISPIGQINLICPIPLHSKKERQRGFNQSTLITKAIAEKFNLPFVSNCLLKIKNTPPQMELKNFEQRTKNTSGSFTVKNMADIAGKTILLVDDVTTTGSTLHEAAKILKAAGAKKIIAFAIAKVG